MDVSDISVGDSLFQIFSLTFELFTVLDKYLHQTDSPLNYCP